MFIKPVSSATGTTVSRQTAYRRLGQIGLYVRRPIRCVSLTATHCHLSREYALWTRQQCFSPDERERVQVSLQLLYGRRQVPVTTKRIS
ncbi:HTH_Tnp_Tc3_2 domain-containing protein [Trichonephila clavipes]|nr:HTH_Tnp_Tc3_2 domain-containing protein [Trichonephila clavipes]